MDQSKSNNQSTSTNQIEEKIQVRTLTVEFFVGLFTIAGVVAAGYLSIGLGDLKIFTSNQYEVIAEFDNISGLKFGASVEIAGVPVGEVSNINLKDPKALVTLKLARNIKIKDDDIVSIRTKGIIGDRYVKISRGASDMYIGEGGTITETESVVDMEDIIGKIVHNLGNDSDKEEDNSKEEK